MIIRSALKAVYDVRVVPGSRWGSSKSSGGGPESQAPARTDKAGQREADEASERQNFITKRLVRREVHSCPSLVSDLV